MNIYGTEKSDIPAANSQGDGNTTPVMIPTQSPESELNLSGESQIPLEGLRTEMQELRQQTEIMRYALQREQEEITRLNSIIRRTSAIRGEKFVDALVFTVWRTVLDLSPFYFVCLPSTQLNIESGFNVKEFREKSPWSTICIEWGVFLMNFISRLYPLGFFDRI